jgi:hypothetical protein
MERRKLVDQEGKVGDRLEHDNPTDAGLKSSKSYILYTTSVWLTNQLVLFHHDIIRISRA